MIPVIVANLKSIFSARASKFAIMLSTVPVGGISIPVDKFSLLAPYIGLTTLLAVAVTIVAYVKKRKRNTEINS